MASDIDSAARETYKKTTASPTWRYYQNRSVNVANYDILWAEFLVLSGTRNNKRRL
jgi:hypothetical protein